MIRSSGAGSTGGPVRKPAGLYAAPFIKPAVVRRCCPEEGIETLKMRVRWALEHMAEHKKGKMAAIS